MKLIRNKFTGECVLESDYKDRHHVKSLKCTWDPIKRVWFAATFEVAMNCYEYADPDLKRQLDRGEFDPIVVRTPEDWLVCGSRPEDEWATTKEGRAAIVADQDCLLDFRARTPLLTLFLNSPSGAAIREYLKTHGRKLVEHIKVVH